GDRRKDACRDVVVPRQATVQIYGSALALFRRLDRQVAQLGRIRLEGNLIAGDLRCGRIIGLVCRVLAAGQTRAQPRGDQDSQEETRDACRFRFAHRSSCSVLLPANASVAVKRRTRADAVLAAISSSLWLGTVGRDARRP